MDEILSTPSEIYELLNHQSWFSLDFSITFDNRSVYELCFVGNLTLLFMCYCFLCAKEQHFAPLCFHSPMFWTQHMLETSCDLNWRSARTGSSVGWLCCFLMIWSVLFLQLACNLPQITTMNSTVNGAFHFTVFFNFSFLTHINNIYIEITYFCIFYFIYNVSFRKNQRIKIMS